MADDTDYELGEVIDRINKKTHIRYHIKNMDTIPNDRFEQGRKLKGLRITLAKFLSWRKENENIIDRAQADLKDADKYIGAVNDAITKIEQDKSLIITEHAVLRYLQRHKGVDLERMCEEIMALPENLIHRDKNTIITVYPEVDGPN